MLATDCQNLGRLNRKLSEVLYNLNIVCQTVIMSSKFLHRVVCINSSYPCFNKLLFALVFLTDQLYAAQYRMSIKI